MNAIMLVYAIEANASVCKDLEENIVK